MAGESYGVCRPNRQLYTLADQQGRYLPVFASAVLDGNKAMKAASKEPINLKSVMIGNGVTDFCESPTVTQLEIFADNTVTTTESYYPYVSRIKRYRESSLPLQQCQTQLGRDEPVQSVGDCVKMAEAVGAYP
jgi:cathepsin A (carboxypeptidase C)